MVRKQLLEALKKHVREPLFILFLVVSASVWYLNRLNEISQKDVTIPLIVDGVDNPMQQNNSRYFAIYARVKSKGYRLLLASLVPQSLQIEINIMDVLSQDGNNGTLLRLDKAKLESVVANKLGDIELVKLYDGHLELNDIEYSSKRVKVYSRLSYDMSEGAMYIEDIKFEPEYVTIKGELTHIAEIDSISTISESVKVDSRRKFSNVRLQDFRGVQVEPSRVSYTLTSTRVFEQKAVKSVKLCFTPGDSTLKQSDFVVIPEHVDILFDVASVNSATFDVNSVKTCVLYEFNRDNGNYIGHNKFKVGLNELPKGVTLSAIEPMYVTVLRKAK